MTSIESSLNEAMKVPVLRRIGGSIIIRDPVERRPLHALWTGLCIDTHGAYWYVGAADEQRNFTKLDGLTFNDAQKQAHALWLVEISRDLATSFGSCHGELEMEPG